MSLLSKPNPTLKEKSAAFEWLKSFADDLSDNSHHALVAAFELEQLMILVKNKSCSRYFGATAETCAKRIIKEGISYPACIWCAQLACIELK